jgi:hypothetical protein
MPNRLHTHMAAMVALEHAIEQRIEYLASMATHNAAVIALLKDLQELAASHRQALAARLLIVAPEVPIPHAASMASLLEGFHQVAQYPTSAALMSLYSLFEQALTGYSVLMVLARRAADSTVGGVGNTDDLVQHHLRDSAAAAQKIVRLLPDIVVTELEQVGDECQCSCPSCSLGICLCAVSTRRMLGMAWTDAGPVYAPEGVSMVLPRSGSAAARAGLSKGDTVLAVDGKEIESLPMLQGAVRQHNPGEEIHLRVQRPSGEQVDICVVRPKDVTGDIP